MVRNLCEEGRANRYLMGKISRQNFGVPPDFIRMLREAVTSYGEGFKIFPEMSDAIQERLRWLEERGYDHHFTIEMITSEEIVRNVNVEVEDFFVVLVINDPDGAFWLRTVFGNKPMPGDYLEQLRECRYSDDDSWWL